MTDAPVSTGMMPSHPGAIVREEILAPLNLRVSKLQKSLACGEPHCPISSMRRPRCPRRWRCASNSPSASAWR